MCFHLADDTVHPNGEQSPKSDLTGVFNGFRFAGPRIATPRPSHSAVPTPSTVKMILRQVQSPTGVRYYRRPDGKLVQLIPISQLKAANPDKTGKSGGVHPNTR